jgi:hypothetical protein
MYARNAKLHLRTVRIQDKNLVREICHINLVIVYARNAKLHLRTVARLPAQAR